jgi:hypothetical protein
MTMTDWKTETNTPWHRAYIEQATQSGLARIADVGELERGLLENQCDVKCAPSPAAEQKIDEREMLLLRDLFVTGPYSNHFEGPAWERLNVLAGVERSGTSLISVRADQIRRGLPAAQHGVSRYAADVAREFGSVDDLIVSLTSPSVKAPPFVSLEKELRERAAEIRAAGDAKARGELVWHIFEGYAKIFDRPDMKFDDAADMHRRALLQVLFSHPDAKYYGASDADGDRLGNAYERLFGLNPLEAEGGWKPGKTEWSPSMDLSGSFDEAAKKIDQWLRANGRADGAYRWERQAITAFLDGGQNGNRKASSSLDERSAITATDVDYGLHLLAASGMDREIAAAADARVLLEQVIGKAVARIQVGGADARLEKKQDGKYRLVGPQNRAVNGRVTMLDGQGRTIVPAFASGPWLEALNRGAPDLAKDAFAAAITAEHLSKNGFGVEGATVRLVATGSVGGNSADEVNARPQLARQWRMEIGGDLSVTSKAPARGEVVAGADVSGKELTRTFDTPIAGVDFLDALESFVVLSRSSDTITPYRVSKDGAIVDRNEKLLPSAQIGSDGKWQIGFRTEDGKAVDAKEVGLFIVTAGGSIKGDAVVRGSKSASWWGMCLELKDFRLATKRLDMPRPAKDVVLTAPNGEQITFTKDEVEKVWARRVLEMTSSSAGYTRMGHRYDARAATVHLKDGRTVRNVELVAEITDRFATASRVHGAVQIPGSAVRGFLQWGEGASTQYLDAALIESVEQKIAADGKVTFIIEHWDEEQTRLTKTTVEANPGVSFDGIAPVRDDQGNQSLVRKNDPGSPIMGKVVLVDGKGQKHVFDPSEVEALVATTKYDVDLLQLLRYVDHHGGVFGGDGSIGPSVSNGAHTADDVARYEAGAANLPSWAKGVLERPKVIGLRGEVAKEDLGKILFFAITQSGSDRYTGWVLLDDDGVPQNGDVVSGRFDFLEMSGVSFRWSAPNVYNPRVPDDLPLMLYVRSLEDPSKASRFLPDGWQRYLGN